MGGLDDHLPVVIAGSKLTAWATDAPAYAWTDREEPGDEY
jgi:hypothetical protein